MSKIPVYFMPGMAASSSIFERIKLPSDTFEMFLLEWELPLAHETLQQYAQRIAAKVTHENSVLIGVSFGGVLVQEMAKFLHLRKLIIISSVKCSAELPRRMKIAKTTKAYKLVPTSLAGKMEKLARYTFGETIKKRIELYDKFLSMRDTIYLDWAIEQMVCWDCKESNPNVIHIHGDADGVFPVKNIPSFINVKGGTHIMILNRYRWFNTHLPKIILGEES